MPTLELIAWAIVLIYFPKALRLLFLILFLCFLLFTFGRTTGICLTILRPLLNGAYVWALKTYLDSDRAPTNIRRTAEALDVIAWAVAGKVVSTGLYLSTIMVVCSRDLFITGAHCLGEVLISVGRQEGLDEHVCGLKCSHRKENEKLQIMVQELLGRLNLEIDLKSRHERETRKLKTSIQELKERLRLLSEESRRKPRRDAEAQAQEGSNVKHGRHDPSPKQEHSHQKPRKEQAWEDLCRHWFRRADEALLKRRNKAAQFPSLPRYDCLIPNCQPSLHLETCIHAVKSMYSINPNYNVAIRKAAIAWHPDRFIGSAEIVKKAVREFSPLVNSLYSELSDIG